MIEGRKNTKDLKAMEFEMFIDNIHSQRWERRKFGLGKDQKNEKRSESGSKKKQYMYHTNIYEKVFL